MKVRRRHLEPRFSPARQTLVLEAGEQLRERGDGLLGMALGQATVCVLPDGRAGGFVQRPLGRHLLAHPARQRLELAQPPGAR